MNKTSLYLLFVLFSLQSSMASAINYGFWDTVDQEITSSPNGNPVGLVCHNCYEHSGLSDTMNKIFTSQDADIVELDVVEYRGEIRVSHDEVSDDASHDVLASLNDVLAYQDASQSPSSLHEMNKVLYIELKEVATSFQRDNQEILFVEEVINILLSNGFGTPDRPVVLRAFNRQHTIKLADNRYNHLVQARQILGANHEGIRLGVLLRPNISESTMRNDIATAYNDGIDLLEFDFQTPQLIPLMTLGRSYGFGIGVFTIGNSSKYGEVFLTTLRNEVDSIVTDYPLPEAKRIIEEPNNLLYFNLVARSTTEPQIEFYVNDEYTHVAPINEDHSPSVLVSETMFFADGRLDFSGDQFIETTDLENQSGNGIMVSAVVKFNSTKLSDNTTEAIVSKADSAGYTLEVTNPKGWWKPTILRFGVRVGSSYVYATRKLSGLDTGKFYLITGAYDADGRVRMWIDNSDSGVKESASISGGVAQNDSPLVIGGDPQGEQGAEDFYTRNHFDGEIQMISIQDWVSPSL